MEEIVRQLAQQSARQNYGKHRAFVEDNADPEKLGRLKLRIPSLLGEQVTAWALPCLPFGGLADQGFFAVPDVGAQVWAEFEAGDLSRPLWVGVFWQASGDAPADYPNDEPTTRIWKTTKGHFLEFEDGDDEEQIKLEHSSGSNVVLDPEGSIALTDSGGAKVTLDAENNQLVIEDANGNNLTMTSSGTTLEDANGNKIEMAASGITVKGQQVVVEGQQVMLGGQGGEPIIKGQSFLTLFMTHMHTTPVGPTSPPVPQGEMSTLSMKVMTS
ncbi:phage baseplate assembly protein V [Thalassomonas sp. RHCl1]|uniref:phage baseplate assembly protein V n=1 Tax=Thalassomonas sp. RHCl1 TaxID=2995320 RepID=UPI00248B9860|nr:phage baseplate assembly protein V [Thalassomonas sp. RHCl1]